MNKSSDLSSWAVREQIDRLQRSNVFAGSERLITLLKFVVDEALGGRADTLKESVIGNAVYGRDPPYDPRIDSTVRVEARRLRRKLDEYYENEGRLDPVRINLPTGGYVPIFTVNSVKGLNSREVGKPIDRIFQQKSGGAAIAIMPFRALSRIGDDETFADGLTDELIFAMGSAEGLRVISRNTIFQYKDRPYSLPALARELGVDAVLQGTVRHDGQVMRVTVEVSDPVGFVQWSDRFDAPDTERMKLQERIATTILSRMRFDSSHMRSMQVTPGPVALDAHAKVYRARQLLDQQTPIALREAAEIFLQVAGSAPDYARGHSGVADCHCDLFRLGLIAHSEASAIAKPAVRRALEIDPHSVEAHAASATISAWLDRDKDAAEADFLRAFKLGKNARAARLYGVFLTIFGRNDEAEKLFREARATEPFSMQQDIAEAVSLYQTRRFGPLIEAGHADKERMSVEVLMRRALAHIFAGRPDDARAFIADIEHVASAFPDLAFARAELEALLGEPQRGSRILNDHSGGATWFARATLAASLNDSDRSLDAVEQAIKQRELSTVWLRTDIRFDRMRDMPRFLELIERMAPESSGPRQSTQS